MSKIQDSSQLTGSSSISKTMKRIIKIPTAIPMFFMVKLSNSGTSDFLWRRRVLEIQDDSQITGSTNNFAGFTDTHVVPKTMQEFITMYAYVRNI